MTEKPFRPREFKTPDTSKNLVFYSKKIEAVLQFYGDKINENVTELVREFLQLKNNLDSDLLYAGLAYFNSEFFLQAQTVIDLALDEGYQAFRDKHPDPQKVNALFFSLLQKARVEKKIPRRIFIPDAPKEKQVENKLFDEAAVEQMGLQLEMVPSHMAADDLIRRIFEKNDDWLDLNNEDEFEMWYTLWGAHVKDLPPPAVPAAKLWDVLRHGKKYPIVDAAMGDGNFDFLRFIARNTTRRDMFNQLPAFGNSESLLVESWPETNVYSEESNTMEVPPLAKKLGITKLDDWYFFKILRKLWESGNYGAKAVRTRAHVDLISSLGLDTDKHYIRSMTVDEYIRLSKKMSLGETDRFMVAEDVYVDKLGNKIHWHIGNSEEGGASGIVLPAYGKKIEHRALPRMVVAPIPSGAILE